MFMFENINLDQAFLCSLAIKQKLTRNLYSHHFITLNLILALALTFLIPQTLILSHHETPLTPSLTLICPIFHDVPIVTRPKHMMLLKVNSYNNKSNPKHYFMMRKVFILSQLLPPLNFILLLKLFLFQTPIPLTNPSY